MSNLPDFLTSIIDAFDSLLKGIGGGFAGFFENITGGSSFGSSAPEGTTTPEPTPPNVDPETPGGDVDPEGTTTPEKPGEDVDAGEDSTGDTGTEQTTEPTTPADGETEVPGQEPLPDAATNQDDPRIS